MQDVLLERPYGRGNAGKLGPLGECDTWPEDRMKTAVHSPVSFQIEFSYGRSKRIIYFKKSSGDQPAGGITDFIVIGSNVQHGS